MSSKRKPYNTYTKEFKLEALRMMDESDRPTSEVAMKLGIRRNQLYKWKEQLEKKGDVAPPKKGRPKKEDQSELSKVKQELKRVQEENEILKKAAVFFAKQLD
ncbi:MAG: transposase [Gammaproteobacteria bacterium]|nr:transposase [Gammaproteobacteria bacterium]